MENNKEYMENEDRFVSDFMADFEPDGVSENFTKDTMNEVMQCWVRNPENINSSISLKGKLFIYLSCVGALILAFFLDFKSLSYGNSFLDIFQFQSTQHSLTKSLQSFVVAFKGIPTFVYVLVLGIALLLVLDRFLGRFTKQKLML